MVQRLGCRVGAFALAVLLAAPAMADDDPFRTAAPPAPVIPKPAPRPPPREEPAPVVAPQPPSRFSADYIARIKQAATEQQVGISDAVVFREDSTPAEYRNYLGAWGPGAWTSGTRYLVVVQAIDPDGSVALIRGWSDSGQGHFKGGWEKLRGKLSGGKLSYDFWYTGTDIPKGQRGKHEFTLTADNSLRGTSTIGNGQIVLPRLQ